jgi:DNA-binding IclR family transcriptional regulator
MADHDLGRHDPGVPGPGAVGGNVTSRPTTPRDQVRGAQRLFVIVEQLSARPMNLTEVARSADLPKSTALRFLRTLEEAGWVFRDRTGTYSLGAAIAGLAAQYLAGNPLVAMATPPMRALQAKLDETISLSRRVGMSRVCVVEFPSTQNLRLVLGLGEQGPLHAGASGILLYAHMPEEERQRLAEQGLRQYTSRTILDFTALEAEAEKVRQQGWVMTRGQKTEGGLAIAAPVAVPGSRTEIAALGVFGPEVRCSTKKEQDIWLRALLETAAEINESSARVATTGSVSPSGS